MSIDRRTALRVMLSSVFGALVARRAPPALPGPRRVAVPLHAARVFGLPYHDAPRVLPTLGVGFPLVLRREPHNPHDELAVAVHTEAGAKLGYVAREDVVVAARLLDAGHEVRATLRAVRPNGWQRLVIDLEALLPEPHG